MLGSMDVAAAAQPVDETFSHAMNHVAQGFEALGALVLVVGIIWSLVLAVVAWRRSGQPAKAYIALRAAFGGQRLLGRGFLLPVALVRLLAAAPTLGTVLFPA